MDAHAARGWVVRNNHFEGIYCTGRSAIAEHAVHFWTGSRDTPTSIADSPAFERQLV